MLRNLLTLALMTLAATAHASVVFYATPGSGPYVALFNTAESNEVDFTEGSGVNAGTFTAADAAIVTAGLDGTASVPVVYSGRVYNTNAATLDSAYVAANPHVGSFAAFGWNGTAQVESSSALNNLLAAFASFGVYGTPALANAPTGSGTPVSPDIISVGRTWIATAYRARNIIEVKQGFVGTFAMKPDLNNATTINSVSAVSITGAATVTATDLNVDRSRTMAHFTVPALNTTGTYTVVVTVGTVDGQTIKTTGTLKVN